MKIPTSRIILQLGLGLLLATGAFAEDTVVRVGELRLTAPGKWYVADVPNDEPNVSQVLASDESPDTQGLLIVSAIPKKGRTLASFNSMSRNFIVRKMDGVIEYERDRAIGGFPAHTFVYEGRSEHAAQGRRKFMRTVIDKGAYFYVLQGVADHVPFAGHAGAIEGMVNSISWNK